MQRVSQHKRTHSHSHAPSTYTRARDGKESTLIISNYHHHQHHHHQKLPEWNSKLVLKFITVEAKRKTFSLHFRSTFDRNANFFRPTRDWVSHSVIIRIIKRTAKKLFEHFNSHVIIEKTKNSVSKIGLSKRWKLKPHIKGSNKTN